MTLSVTVHVKYKDIEETFTGDVDDVWAGINQFFGKMIPLFEATREVVLTVDLVEIVETAKGLVAVAEEGPAVLVPKEKLTDNEGLLLMLLAAYIGGRLGVLDKPWLSKEEMRIWLGKSGKITGTRLGELCRKGLVVRVEDVGFRLSTLGVKQLIDEVLPQIRGKA